jgi:hypothetical protein
MRGIYRPSGSYASTIQVTILGTFQCISYLHLMNFGVCAGQWVSIKLNLHHIRIDSNEVNGSSHDVGVLFLLYIKLAKI